MIENNRTIYLFTKIGIFIFWPIITVLFLSVVAVFFTFVWFAIPFGKLRRKEDGKHEFTFKGD